MKNKQSKYFNDMIKYYSLLKKEADKEVMQRATKGGMIGGTLDVIIKGVKYEDNEFDEKFDNLIDKHKDNKQKLQKYYNKLLEAGEMKKRTDDEEADKDRLRLNVLQNKIHNYLNDEEDDEKEDNYYDFDKDEKNIKQKIMPNVNVYNNIGFKIKNLEDKLNTPYQTNIQKSNIRNSIEENEKSLDMIKERIIKNYDNVIKIYNVNPKVLQTYYEKKISPLYGSFNKEIGNIDKIENIELVEFDDDMDNVMLDKIDNILNNINKKPSGVDSNDWNKYIKSDKYKNGTKYTKLGEITELYLNNNPSKLPNNNIEKWKRTDDEFDIYDYVGNNNYLELKTKITLNMNTINGSFKKYYINNKGKKLIDLMKEYNDEIGIPLTSNKITGESGNLVPYFNENGTLYGIYDKSKNSYDKININKGLQVLFYLEDGVFMYDINKDPNLIKKFDRYKGKYTYSLPYPRNKFNEYLIPTIYFKQIK